MPSTGRLLLDTNAVIALFAREPLIERRLEVATDVFVSCVALGELYFGARKSTRPTENLTRVEEFSTTVAVLPCDSEIARTYGIVKNRLREKARPIPENDVWIAATACNHDLILLTRDAHFDSVEGLTVASW